MSDSPAQPPPETPETSAPSEGHPPPPQSLIWLGRIGFSAKGAVLITLGLLAVNGAVRVGDHTAPLPVEERTAVRAIRHAPMGSYLVAALSVGLLCYAVWLGGRAILDPSHAGRRVTGLLKRGWLLWLGLVNLALATSAGALAIGLARENHGSRGARVDHPGGNVTDAAGRLLSSTAARQIFVVLGVVSFIYGAVTTAQAVRGRSSRWREPLPPGRLPRWRRRLLRLNLAGRGVITLALGVLLALFGFFNSLADLQRLYKWYEAEIHSHFGRPALITVAVGLLGWGTIDLLRVVHPLASLRLERKPSSDNAPADDRPTRSTADSTDRTLAR